MHFKCLEIQGFKSFPEYTLIEFHEGMTAIVGPNGSGKSNVTDAVRWVLGEQSIKTLRGGKMEDVIFNGTQSRRAMNYAEVSVTLDNEDHQLAIEYGEVKITRRLYRSGESEYLINGGICRRKDVLTLFMDTGLGKDGYSIIGQGRVDEILSSKSEDRRKILEEAAGIVKFKSRKEEGERKLLATEQNLLRLTDIVGQMGEQIGPLEEQSYKAKEYHKLYEAWKSLDVAWILHQIEHKQVSFFEINQYKLDLKIRIQEQEQHILQRRQKNQALSSRKNALEQTMEEITLQMNQTQEQENSLQKELAILAERKEQLENQILLNQGEDQDWKANYNKLDGEKEQQKRKLDQLEKQKKIFQIRLSQQEACFRQLFLQVDENQKIISDWNEQIENKQEEIFAINQEIQELSGQEVFEDSQLKNFQKQKQLLINQKDGLQIEGEEAQDTYTKLLRKKEKLEQQKALQQETLENLQQIKKEKTGALEIDLRNASHLEYRMKVLQELEDNKEGYQEPVRRLLKASTENPSIKNSIVGVLGELIKVEERYEACIEVALGQAIHFVVTPTQQQGANVITFLKKQYLGRVTFLPVDTIQGKELESGYLKIAEDSPGFIGLASQLVSYPEALEDIIKNLLSRIVVTDTLEAGMKIAEKTGHSFRIVTLEGDVIHPGGSLTGGSSKKQGTSILGRIRELEQLHIKQKAQKDKIATDQDAIKKIEQKIVAEARIDAEMDNQMQQLKMEKIRQESQLNQLQVTSIQINDLYQKLEQDDKQALENKEKIQAQSIDYQEKISLGQQQIKDWKAKIKEKQSQDTKVEEDLENLRTDIGDLKISVSSIEETYRGAGEIFERIEKEQQSLEKNGEKRQARLQEAMMEVENLALKKQEIFLVLQKKLSCKDKQMAEMEDIQRQRQATEVEMGDFAEVLSKATVKLTSLQNEDTRLEDKILYFETEIDDLKNRLWEDHELTFDNAIHFKMDFSNQKEPSKQISGLKNKMKALGPVNLNAIDEFVKMKEKYDFMMQQKMDIEKSKQQLHKMIKDLEVEMHEQFQEHFVKINQNFKRIFSDLFNGGTAEILLDNENDILGSEIDIKAQPPGKKLQSLTLLSGGERCLTAIALLFAILALRPSPFCILDEVEAALDDANIQRFAKFVRRYAQNSQFILVTHRKGTMEACDRMYGVTMQERGISKILSMELGNE